jgi:uncharacterized protein (TIGR02246 family)
MNKVSRIIFTSSILACSFISMTSSLPAMSAPGSVHVVRVNGDEDAIKNQISALRGAVSSAQPAAVAALWTADGTYIDQNGRRFVGRTELEKRFAGVFQANGKILVDIAPEQIRFLAPTVAATSGVVTQRGESLPETRFNMIFVKQNGTWQIASATETPFQVVRSAQPLASLDWLVGDWVAERNGGSVRMKAEWTSNRNFIRCQYEINKPGQPAEVDYQFIGWDPKDGGGIASWSFGANGGCGYGHWNQTDKGWVVDSNGTAPDGSKMYARNIITVADPNNFSWQSVDRKVAGIAFGDTDPLEIKRAGKQSASSR